jgi:hypothetical protein
VLENRVFLPIKKPERELRKKLIFKLRPKPGFSKSFFFFLFLPNGPIFI